MFAYLPVPTRAAVFAKDSFSQEVGDSYVWELMHNQSAYTVYERGMRFKVVVNVLNISDDYGVLRDSIYVNVSRNTPSNRTWDQYYVDYPLVFYNSTYGLIVTDIIHPTFIPHNESAVNKTYYSFFSESPFNYNYKWTSGPHGYDGTAEGWTGNGTGELNELKMSFKFNGEGVIEF
ncbi:MAG: hypothetical protein RBG13Loki_1402 [Promethearchaeota archaeon CR_4]|nr:MAG: hypothetical protein RBG13Loki_1402 [Candidatus Lokiarchaeota archaeon CR_4]